MHAPEPIDLTAEPNPHPVGRQLPRGIQLTVVVVAAGAALALFAFRAVVLAAIAGSPADKPAEAADAAFKPTAAQWAAFAVADVHAHDFADLTRTDGVIAVDDDRSTQVFSPYTGRVTRVVAKAGDVVKQGDVLFAVEASEFVQAQNDLVAAVATLRTARAQLRMSQTSEKRAHDLFLAQGGALKDWQQSQVDLATAQGGLDAAEVALGAVRGRLRILGKSDADIAALEASPGHTTASPEVEVKAPIAGTVTQRQISVGQLIVSASGGETAPVFTIGDLSKVWLIANVREADAGLAHVGDPVAVTALALPGQVFKATVDFVGAAIDPTTRRLPVRAQIDNPVGLLKPQMFATFRITSGHAVAAPGVPDKAIVYEGDTAHVWLAHPDSKTLEIRQVSVGRSDGGLIEITHGLVVGDHVVTSGGVFIDRATTAD